jgi:hypothetical protein
MKHFYCSFLILFTFLSAQAKINPTVSDITEEDFRSHIGYLASDWLKGRSSGTYGDYKAVEYIKNHFESAGMPRERYVEVQEHFVFKDRRTKKRKVKTYNVIVTLPGQDPLLKDEIVVIGGHYDSVKNVRGKIHNGADDNASGTSMVLELFEKHASTMENKRTLVFMAFGGEELGLLGSKYFTENPTIDLSKVQIMINLDMVGRLDSEKNLQLGGTATAENLDQMLDPFFDDISLNITELGKGIFSRSDHYSFYKKDIPVLFFFTGLHTDYHSATDEADRVNYSGMMEIAELVNEIVEYFTNKEDRLVFTKAPMEDQQMTTPTKLKGTLGIMPDYAGDIKGLKVDAVIENKAAQQAGIIDNDIVTAINNVSIESIYDYMRIMANLDNEQFCNGPVEGCVLPVGITRGEESLTINVTF